tara:strand:+ start:183 stop:1097 length:915 start_codon:yes stop_codon:yes gene_type:complete
MKKKYGKVLVLMGGWSNEREISLISGKYVLESLISSGVNAISFDLNKDNLHEIKQINPDRVFIILHGKGGEDGEIQLFLDNLNIPYTGSGSNASKICMNKRISKDILLDNNISTPFYKKFDNKDDIEDLEKIFKYPFIVKPSSEGSSIGVNIVENRQDFHQAIKDNKLISNDILIEEYIDGIEYTVGILHDRALPVIKLIPPGKFYDFNAKYKSSETQYLCPSELEKTLENSVKAQSLQCFKALNCTGWGRVDLIIDKSGKSWVIELNTVPGMTKKSLVPMAAQQINIDFNNLVLNILDTSFAN